jgi:hypothetical protein
MRVSCSAWLPRGIEPFFVPWVDLKAYNDRERLPELLFCVFSAKYLKSGASVGIEATIVVYSQYLPMVCPTVPTNNAHVVLNESR